MSEGSWITNYLDFYPKFPIEEVTFVTYTKLLQSPEAFEKVIKAFAEKYKSSGITSIAAIDSRGFIFGAPLALEMGCKLVLIRKPGKTPKAITTEPRQMEYASISLEIEKGALNASDNVLVVDDIIATGSTLVAASELVEKSNANISGLAAILDLSYIPTVADLKSEHIFSMYSLTTEDLQAK